MRNGLSQRRGGRKDGEGEWTLAKTLRTQRWLNNGEPVDSDPESDSEKKLGEEGWIGLRKHKEHKNGVRNGLSQRR